MRLTITVNLADGSPRASAHLKLLLDLAKVLNAKVQTVSQLQAAAKGRAK